MEVGSWPHDQYCRKEGGIRSTPQPFEESLLLERKDNITTIFGLSCWFRFFFLVRSEDWHMLRPLKL